MALRGVLSIVFGVLLFVWPVAGLSALVLPFGAYALADGVVAVVAALRGHGQARWWTVPEGAVGVIAGLAAFLVPALTAVVLPYVIAARAIVTGVFEMIAAVRLRREIENAWLLAIVPARRLAIVPPRTAPVQGAALAVGVLSLLFGVYLLVFLLEGVLVPAWTVGAYALSFGSLLLLLGFRLRGMAGRGGTAATG